MSFQIGSNFRLNSQAPLDDRIVVVDGAARDALSAQNRAYKGLIVYVINENTYYYYNSNNEWAILNISGGSINSFTLINSTSNLSINRRYAISTNNGSFTVTLPLGTYGASVEIIDINGTFDINNLTIDRNGYNIEGEAENLICNVKNAHFILVWNGSSWQISVLDNNLDRKIGLIPLLYLKVEGASELFDSPDSQNFKIPWNTVEWANPQYVITGTNIDNSKIITYNPINKNIYFSQTGIYNIDLRYGSFNLVDSTDFLRARLRSSGTVIDGGLADITQPQPRIPTGQVDSRAAILAAFAQGPIGTSFNGEAMQAGFTTFTITGATYLVTEFLHFGAFNTNNSLTRGYPVNNNQFGNQPFMFLSKIV